MKIVLNGERIELPDGTRLVDAVAASGAPTSRRGVAVAVDGEVVPHARWESERLSDGQQVEVVQAVQGG